MITPPTAPSPGKPVSAGFFSRLISWVKSGQLIEGVGYRLHRTPNGTSLVLNPSKGGATSPAAKSPGRFEITLTADEMPEGSEPEEQTYTATFANPYYDIGGKTYEMSDEEVSLEGIRDGSIIYIKLSAEGSGTGAELGTSLSLTELQSLQENSMGCYTVPLYKVQGGSVVCDFRTGPIAGMGEA